MSADISWAGWITGETVCTRLHDTGTIGGKLLVFLGDELEFVDEVIDGLLLSRLFVAICLRDVEFLSRLLVTMWCRRSMLDTAFISV